MKRKTRYPLSQVIPQNSSSTGYTQITWGTSISIECNKGVWERMPSYTPGRYTCIILTVLLYRSNESTSNPYQRPHFHSTKKNKFCLWKYIYIYIYLFHTPTYVDLFIYMHAWVMEMKFDDLFFLSYFHKVRNYLVAAGAP